MPARAAPPAGGWADAGVTPLSGARSRAGLARGCVPPPCARVFVNGRPGRWWVILIFERRPDPAPRAA